MIVKIIQSEPDTWYTDKVGQEFEVLKRGMQIQFDKDLPYLVSSGGVIFCKDFIIISNKEYPTLNANYKFF